MTKKMRNCEVCGQKVTVYTSRGGTSSYNPEAEDLAKKLNTFINRISPAWLPKEVRDDRQSLLREARIILDE